MSAGIGPRGEDAASETIPATAATELQQLYGDLFTRDIRSGPGSYL